MASTALIPTSNAPITDHLPNGAQFIRKVGLLVGNGTNVIDLSNLRITFHIEQCDTPPPNTASIRVYNLSRTTLNTIISNGGSAEYTQVILQAGYQNSAYGVIFKGDIKRFRHGRESNIDSYLDILAADADIEFNFGFINQTLAKGSNLVDRYNRVLQAFAQARGSNSLSSAQSNPGVADGCGGVVLKRGKVLFGMARAAMDDIVKTINVKWSIQNGVLTFVPLTGYLPGQAVQLNSYTGLIGTPEATDNGVHVKCLLNPNIKVGGLVQINNALISQTKITASGATGYPDYGNLYFPADTTADGFYRVLVVEYEGDTRGNPWFANLICLAADTSASSNTGAVKAYG
jgi:hypothetical protein